MDKFFTTLDEMYTEENDISRETCCDNMKNHQVNNGITLCSTCKNTITNIISGPEWRYYGVNDTKSSDPTRCGMPVNQLLPESSLSTTISYRGGKSNMRKIRKYQQWNGVPYKERSLLKVFEEISRNCKKHNISTMIINEANSLYKVISMTKITRGSNRCGVIAACVYFSCKINKVPRSTNEIADVFNITIPVMSKGCKKFQEIMHMNKIDLSRINYIHSTDTITINDFIDRFCSKLTLNEQDTCEIKGIAKMATIYNLINENTPPSMAAGCIYLYIKINELDIHKKIISDICKISEVTINKCYKKLETYSDKIIC
jgi:transcription initiation factor TFIIB